MASKEQVVQLILHLWQADDYTEGLPPSRGLDRARIILYEDDHPAVTLSAGERARIKRAVGFLRSGEEAGNVQD